MQVRVKSLQGDEYLIQVQNDQTVHQLKASISEKANGLPIERQKLVYKGRTMQDTSLVGDYNLEEDCKVHLILQKERELSSSSPSSSGGVHATANTNTPTGANSSSSLANNNKQTSSTSPSNSTQSNNSQSPMDVSVTLRNNDDVIRMLGQWGASGGGGASSEDRLMDDNSGSNDNNNTSNNSSISGQQQQRQQHQSQSRFEVILRERLAAFFPSESIDRIMENLYQEIDADVNTSSLDDLERLAKQKLNITNE